MKRMVGESLSVSDFKQRENDMLLIDIIGICLFLLVGTILGGILIEGGTEIEGCVAYIVAFLLSIATMLMVHIEGK